MPKTIKEEELRLTLSVSNREIKLKDAAIRKFRIFPHY